MNEALSKSKLFGIGGADGTVVAVGGWGQMAGRLLHTEMEASASRVQLVLTVSGHGPFTAQYGLGVDQYLEVKVVTADGKHLVCNKVSNPDLFWAIRGGGGGTFGVVVEATLKVYREEEIFPMTAMTFWVKSTSYLPSKLYEPTQYLLNQLPALYDKGISGYFLPIIGNIRGLAMHPNADVATVNALWKPILEKLQSYPTMQPFQSKPLVFDNFTQFYTAAFGTWESHFTKTTYLKDAPSNMGVVPMESWFLKKEHIQGQKFIDAMGGTNGLATFLLVQPHPKLGNGNDTSTHPGWRDAAIYSTGFKIPGVTNFESFRKLNPAPQGGAYSCECNAEVPNWQESFWGSNYPKLAQIKTQYDPSGLFWTTPGINAEQWEVKSGRVCKVNGKPVAVAPTAVAPTTDDATSAHWLLNRKTILGSFQLIEKAPPSSSYLGLQPTAVPAVPYSLPI
ncbi:hypothetical protein BT63DRAFT_430112 [Microthyrium microscopicum]|uniref:FAD-binding PCMH-type domain-containing protein n=1 Tax=Microthyrium microscopicum TaxID=703497 RepID=A0A6A6TYC7_9PEZI|nr:hypothetical protein BT63DRAFT_430112 [Microthyrium microscopicum]